MGDVSRGWSESEREEMVGRASEDAARNARGEMESKLVRPRPPWRIGRMAWSHCRSVRGEWRREEVVSRRRGM